MAQKKVYSIRTKKKKMSEEEIFDFIQDRAYRLWDQAGRPQGKDWEFWFKAEKEINDRLKKVGKI